MFYVACLYVYLIDRVNMPGTAGTAALPAAGGAT
jgi:hypothetical protein